MSLVEQLSARTLDRLVAGTGAREVASPTEVMRVFEADGGLRIVATTLAVRERGVVTCMIFAFTAADSAVPHFTLDCGQRPDGYAFHLDLVPRVELATHLTYMDALFEPLSEVYAEGSATAGLSATGTSRRQIALMSPWMILHQADEAAFRAIEPTVEAYADHWLALVRDGVPAEVLATIKDTDLAAHDAAVRANLFNPSVDPVWGRVHAMIGDDAAAAIRAELVR